MTARLLKDPVFDDWAEREGVTDAMLRKIVAYKRGLRLIFLYGFAESERDNISDKERKALGNLGDAYMTHDDESVTEMVTKQLLVEIR